MTTQNDFNAIEDRRAEHAKFIHQHMDWGDVRVDLVGRTGMKRQETHVLSSRHAFLINLSGKAKNGEDFVDGRRVSFVPRGAGSCVFLPAHSQWRGWDEGDSTGSYLFVSIDPDFIGGAFDPDHLKRLQANIGFREAMIGACLQRIGAEIKCPDPLSRVMVESQAVQLFTHLVRLNGNKEDFAKGGLSAFDLKRLMMMIEARVQTPPSLAEMAEEVGLSTRHLYRAFKASTGKSPHAFLAERRLKSAVGLMQTTEMTATEIAFATGFSTPAQLTLAMTRTYGVGTLEFRARWRSKT